MSKKFVRVKRLIIPMLTAALLLSTTAPALALSINEVASFDADGVAIEAIVPQAQAGNIVAVADTSETEEFWIRPGYAGRETNVVKGQHIDIDDSTNDLVLITLDETLTIDDLDIEIPAGVAVDILLADYEDQDPTTVNKLMWSNVPERMAWIKSSDTSESTDTTTPETTTTPTETTTPTPITTEQSTSATETPVFADVQPGSWYYESVTAMAKGGLLQGYSDGLFHPDDVLTVGQFATILARITNLNTTPKEGAHWASGALASVAGKAIYIRLDEQADEAVNRGEAITSMVELAKELWKYATTDESQAAGPTPTNMDFRIEGQAAWLKQMTEKVWTFDSLPDGDVVKTVGPSGHTWNSRNILLAYNLGIVHGIDAAGTCAPEALLTRAEVCELLYQMGISKAGDVTIHGYYGFG